MHLWYADACGDDSINFKTQEKAYTSSFKTLQTNGFASKTGHEFKTWTVKLAVLEVLGKKLKKLKRL